MKTTLDTSEKLGPLDLGREEKWTHLRDDGAKVCLCGHPGTGRSPVPFGTMRGRHCPDCLRIWEMRSRR